MLYSEIACMLMVVQCARNNVHNNYNAAQRFSIDECREADKLQNI